MTLIPSLNLIQKDEEVHIEVLLDVLKTGNTFLGFDTIQDVALKVESSDRSLSFELKGSKDKRHWYLPVDYKIMVLNSLDVDYYIIVQGTKYKTGLKTWEHK